MAADGLTSNHWKIAGRKLPIIGSFLLSRVRAPAFSFLLVALLLVLPGASQARVFWTIAGGETSGVLASDAAWTRAYSAMLRINSGRAGLEVWSARLSLTEAVEALRAKVRQGGGEIWFTGVGEMVWGIGCDGERVFRFLVTATQNPRSSLVFQLSQSFEDFTASLTPPQEHLLKAAPAYPNSEEKSFLASEATRTEMATSTAGSPPADVKNFYAERLPGGGWAPVFQPGKGLDVYLRGNEVILVSAESAGDSGGSVIMLLHKPLTSAEHN